MRAGGACPPGKVSDTVCKNGQHGVHGDIAESGTEVDLVHDAGGEVGDAVPGRVLGSEDYEPPGGRVHLSNLGVAVPFPELRKALGEVVPEGLLARHLGGCVGPEHDDVPLLGALLDPVGFHGGRDGIEGGLCGVSSAGGDEGPHELLEVLRPLGEVEEFGFLHGFFAGQVAESDDLDAELFDLTVAFGECRSELFMEGQGVILDHLDDPVHGTGTVDAHNQIYIHSEFCHIYT